MFIASAKLTFRIPHSLSLKDKRQVRRSVSEKTRGKFNVSISEVAEQDSHKTLVLGFAAVSESKTHAEQILQSATDFAEKTAAGLGGELMREEFDEVWAE